MPSAIRCRTRAAAYLLLAFACTGAAFGADRPPKIGLALSGGGARGAAHVGVLKILERERVPIHCIAGTSFGSVVGGLYALGYSAAQIEEIFTSQDWDSLFSDAPERRLTPVAEIRDYRYLGQLPLDGLHPSLPAGLRVGQRMIETLSALTLPRMGTAQGDFDRLPIPFRAVATDLVTGRPYVFSSGPMAEAMRASFAVPIIFTPVEKEGMLLTDGGLSNNLPTDIARQMGADLVIAVDVTAPLLEKSKIRNLLDVMDQSISLLMRQNVIQHAALAALTIRPELEGIIYSEYGRIAEIIGRGTRAAESRVEELRRLAAQAAPAPPPPAPPAPVIVQDVEFQGLRKVRAERVTGETMARSGKEIQPRQLLEDMRRLYATRLFESIYAGTEPAGERCCRLVYKMKEAAPHVLGASLRYDQDHQFVALVEGTARRLFGTPSSATLSTQLGGLEDYSLALRLVPSGAPRFYFEPKVHLRQRERQDLRDGEFVNRYTDRRIGGQLAAGGVLPGRLDIQVAYASDLARIKGGSVPYRLDGRIRLAGLSWRAQRDGLDAQDFPAGGTRLRLQVDKRNRSLGSDLDHTKIQGELAGYWTPAPGNTFVGLLAVGLSRGAVPFFDRYYAGGMSYSEGGPQRFLGLDQDEVLAKQLAVLSAGLRRQIFAAPLGFARRGFIRLEYNGMGLSQRDVPPYEAKYVHGFGAVFALDTMLGPMRFGGGWAEGGRGRFYLSIGPEF